MAIYLNIGSEKTLDFSTLFSQLYHSATNSFFTSSSQCTGKRASLNKPLINCNKSVWELQGCNKNFSNNVCYIMLQTH